MEDIIIRNGLIVDVKNEKIAKGDISVKDGKIVKVCSYIEEHATSEIDADGCYVTPGLIDHHTHIYPLAAIGTAGEAVCFGSGVTTAVDAGSTGCDNYEQYRGWIGMEKLSIMPYINVCSVGLSTLPKQMEDVKPEHMDVGKLKELFDKYGDELLGLKLRTSKNIVGELGLEPLKAAVEIGEKINRPLMVHITNPPAEMEKVLEILRPGDIVTHMYQNVGYTILKNGHVADCVWKARERGIIFEAADARAHFSFEVSEKAIAEKFYPDLLGTDVTRLSMHLRPTAFNMAMQISKYTYLGMPFEKVIKAATWNNAENMGISDRVGSLKEGKQADIAVFRVHEGKNVFGDRPYTDETASFRESNRVFEPVLTVKKGEMVYRNVTF